MTELLNTQKNFLTQNRRSLILVFFKNDIFCTPGTMELWNHGVDDRVDDLVALFVFFFGIRFEQFCPGGVYSPCKQGAPAKKTVISRLP